MRTYLIGFFIIQFIPSSFFFILHLISIDFINVLSNIEGLDLSNINDFQIYSINIVILVALITLLVLNVLFIFVDKLNLTVWKKLIYGLIFLSFSIISIINTYDIARIFFEKNPIIINVYPTDTASYIFRAFMIVVFVISLIVLNLGFSASIHTYIIQIKSETHLMILLLFLFFINFMSFYYLFNI